MTEWSPIRPPQIGDVTPGPRGTTPQVEPTALPGPVVQVVQAPNAPDPAGLGAAFTLLGQPNIFRDMSGRAELEHLLSGLVSGAVSLTEAQILARQVKDKQAAGTGTDTSTGSAATRTPAAEADAGRQVDRLDIIDQARKSGLISAADARGAALGVVGGEESGTGGSGDAGTGGGALPYVTPDLKRHLAATVLAESAEGQENKIGWIYFNLVSTAKGETGLTSSAAYSHKGIWYRIWLYVLGDNAHAKDPLPDQKEFAAFKGQTVKDFCDKNGWVKTVAVPRARRFADQVEAMFADQLQNPYKGWTGQGSLNDFNNKSNNDVYWKKARAYWWLQQGGKVSHNYVEMLPGGVNTQFIFDANAIDAYFRKNPLPDKVPEYAP